MITFPSFRGIKPTIKVSPRNGKFKDGEYKFIVVPIGKDQENGGVTIAESSRESDWVTLRDGDGVYINMDVPLEKHPLAYAVFLHKKRERGYKLWAFLYGGDKPEIVFRDPLRSTPKFGKKLLQSYDSDPVLGSRIAKGIYQ